MKKDPKEYPTVTGYRGPVPMDATIHHIAGRAFEVAKGPINIIENFFHPTPGATWDAWDAYVLAALPNKKRHLRIVRDDECPP